MFPVLATGITKTAHGERKRYTFIYWVHMGALAVGAGFNPPCLAKAKPFPDKYSSITQPPLVTRTVVDANRGGLKTRAYADKTVFRRNLESKSQMKHIAK